MKVRNGCQDYLRHLSTETRRQEWAEIQHIGTLVMNLHSLCEMCQKYVVDSEYLLSCWTPAALDTSHRCQTNAPP